MSYDFWDTPPPSSGRFAMRLRQLRCGAGLTAESLAAMAGIPLAAYLSFEASRSHVTAAATIRLAAALGIVPDLFFES